MLVIVEKYIFRTFFSISGRFWVIFWLFFPIWSPLRWIFVFLEQIIHLEDLQIDIIPRKSCYLTIIAHLRSSRSPISKIFGLMCEKMYPKPLKNKVSEGQKSQFQPFWPEYLFRRPKNPYMLSKSCYLTSIGDLRCSRSPISNILVPIGAKKCTQNRKKRSQMELKSQFIAILSRIFI